MASLYFIKNRGQMTRTYVPYSVDSMHYHKPDIMIEILQWFLGTFMHSLVQYFRTRYDCLVSSTAILLFDDMQPKMTRKISLGKCTKKYAYSLLNITDFHLRGNRYETRASFVLTSASRDPPQALTTTYGRVAREMLLSFRLLALCISQQIHISFNCNRRLRKSIHKVFTALLSYFRILLHLF
jgi:hypothetical protein